MAPRQACKSPLEFPSPTLMTMAGCTREWVTLRSRLSTGSISLPTSTHDLGSDHVTVLLPIWGQKDFDHWSIFGGGGYAINPGAGNRNYWTGGIAISREVSDTILIGIEADRQGADEMGGRASTSLGVGAILQLPKAIPPPRIRRADVQ
jgi:hypothetical protein